MPDWLITALFIAFLFVFMAWLDDNGPNNHLAV